MSFGDVSSANVVGFQNKEAKTGGWNLSCNTFLGVGKEKSAMTLGDFVPNESWDMFGGDRVMFLKPSGAPDVINYDGQDYEASFTYISADWITAMEWTITPGWYQQDEAVNNFNFIPGKDWVVEYGDGLVVEVQNEGTALVYSGEVLKGCQNLTVLPGGWNLRGNATPCDTTLAGITPNEIWDMFGGDRVMFLKQSGAPDVIKYDEQDYEASFTYISADWITAMEWTITPGWYQQDEAVNNFNFIPGKDWAIPAGDAFVVEVQNDGVEVQLPAAIAE